MIYWIFMDFLYFHLLYILYSFFPSILRLVLGSRNSGGAESERGLGAKKSLRRGRRHWE